MPEPDHDRGGMGSGVDPDSAGAIAPAEIGVSRGSDGGWTVVVRGEVDIATSPVLRAELERLDGDAPVVIDVTDMTFIDSSGLGVLVEFLKRRRESGTAMTLRGMQEPVRRVFEITGLTDLFSFD
jgi:anti-sigma B factor antagonist